MIMPSRKRSNIGAKTTNAKKNRIRRTLESQSDKEKRLSAQRIRQSKLRASESTEKRNERLAEERKRKYLERIAKKAHAKRLLYKSQSQIRGVKKSYNGNTLKRRQPLPEEKEPADAEDVHEDIMASHEIEEILIDVDEYSCYTNYDSDNSTVSETF